MNQLATAKAFKIVLAKKAKIKELGITPEMSEDDRDVIIKNLSGAKALETGEGTWKDYSKGQEWYVDDLWEFSKLSTEEQLQKEELEAFPKVSDRDELLEYLNKI